MKTDDDDRGNMTQDENTSAACGLLFISICLAALRMACHFRRIGWPLKTTLNCRAGIRIAMLTGIMFLAMPGARATPLALTANDQVVAVAGHLSMLHDPEGSMTLDAVTAARETFQPIAGTFNAGYSPRGAWWLRVTLRPENNAGGAWLLELAAPYTDSIDVYMPTPSTDGRVKTIYKKTGSLVPLSQRDLFSHLFVVRTDLTALQEQDIYIRLSGTRALTAAPVMWRESPFLSHLTSNGLLIAFIVGAASITALGAVIFGLWLRTPAFIWYGAYLGLAALVVLGNTGILTFVLSPLSPATVLRLQGMIGCTTVMAGAFVVRAIFCEHGRHPIIARVFTIIGSLAGVGIIPAAFGYYGVIAPALNINLLILCLLVPWVSAMRLKRREPAAGWYFVGFTAYGLSGVWLTLMVMGVLPMSTFGERGYQITSVLNMATILVGLATSVRAGARERRGLQSQLLQASQRNERALEQAVSQRTLALEAEVEARRSAEAALIVALREQRHFLAMVSHEFRTPLASLRVAIAVIERKLSEADVIARREATRIVRTIARLSHLIDAFLAEDVLDKNALQLRRCQVDLPVLVHDICQEHVMQMERDIRIDAPAHCEVEGDYDLLRIAIENLVINAIRYSEGAVHVDVSPTDGGVTVVVRDTGPGIPEEERRFIFDRYYRTSGTRSHAGIGVGIGLSIVRKIIDLHGGAVNLESELGAGSTFRLWLPSVAQTPETVSAHADSP